MASNASLAAMGPVAHVAPEAEPSAACPACRGTGEALRPWHAWNFREMLRDHGSGFGWFRCECYRVAPTKAEGSS